MMLVIGTEPAGVHLSEGKLHWSGCPVLTDNMSNMSCPRDI